MRLIIKKAKSSAYRSKDYFTSSVQNEITTCMHTYEGTGKYWREFKRKSTLPSYFIEDPKVLCRLENYKFRIHLCPAGVVA
jgi:hypothetical protein